jgi:hypothetical protein
MVYQLACYFPQGRQDSMSREEELPHLPVKQQIHTSAMQRWRVFTIVSHIKSSQKRRDVARSSMLFRS